MKREGEREGKGYATDRSSSRKKSNKIVLKQKSQAGRGEEAEGQRQGRVEVEVEQ